MQTPDARHLPPLAHAGRQSAKEKTDLAIFASSIFFSLHLTCACVGSRAPVPDAAGDLAVRPAPLLPLLLPEPLRTGPALHLLVAGLFSGLAAADQVGRFRPVRVGPPLLLETPVDTGEAGLGLWTGNQCTSWKEIKIKKQSKSCFLLGTYCRPCTVVRPPLSRPGKARRRRSLPRGRRYIQLLRSRDWDGKDLKKNFNIITDFLKTYIIPILASVVSAFSILPQV